LFLHTSAVNSVACSPDGSALIWCAADGAVGFWDRKQKTNRTIAPLCPPAGVVRWAAFAKDGYFMTLNSNDTLTVLRRGE
jgi:WD40 repeat protein